MPLPVIPRKTGDVEVKGVPVHFRSLSRAEAVQARNVPEDKRESFLFCAAFDATEAEVAEWVKSTDWDDVEAVLDEIVILSGLRTREQIDAANALARGEEVKTEVPDPQP